MLLVASSSAGAVWDGAANAARAVPHGAISGGDANERLGEGFIVVYNDDVTRTQIAAARATMAQHFGAGNVALEQAVNTPAASGDISLAAAPALGPDAADPKARAAPAFALMRLDVFKPAEAGGQLPDDIILLRLEALPGVAYAERDGIVTAQATEQSPPWCAPRGVPAYPRPPARHPPPAAPPRAHACLHHAPATQPNRRGLNRIDQRKLPLDKDYTYPDIAGAGATIYVADTGIFLNHSEFEGRAAAGWVAPALAASEGGGDRFGHGTREWQDGGRGGEEPVVSTTG